MAENSKRELMWVVITILVLIVVGGGLVWLLINRKATPGNPSQPIASASNAKYEVIEVVTAKLSETEESTIKTARFGTGITIQSNLSCPDSAVKMLKYMTTYPTAENDNFHHSPQYYLADIKSNKCKESETPTEYRFYEEWGTRNNIDVPIVVPGYFEETDKSQNFPMFLNVYKFDQEVSDGETTKLAKYQGAEKPQKQAFPSVGFEGIQAAQSGNNIDFELKLKFPNSCEQTEVEGASWQWDSDGKTYVWAMFNPKTAAQANPKPEADGQVCNAIFMPVEESQTAQLKIMPTDKPINLVIGNPYKSDDILHIYQADL